jgi:hypothetical protein
MIKIRTANTLTDGFRSVNYPHYHLDPMSWFVRLPNGRPALAWAAWLCRLTFGLRLLVSSLYAAVVTEAVDPFRTRTRFWPRVRPAGRMGLLVVLLSWFSTTILAQETTGAAESSSSPQVVINEILIDPLNKQDLLEFVELYNPNNYAVDLSFWTLSDAVDFFFPPGTTIAAGGYLVVAQEPGALWSRTGVAALGPFVGRLNNEGETITLRDNRAALVDEVSYGLGFPWPITGVGDERSIQLINPALDNTRPSHWRSAPPTPGAANATLVENPPPSIEAVTHTPAAPTSADTIRVSATVSDSDGVAAVYLQYQVVAPGEYIRLTDPAYQTQWTTLAMVAVGADRFEIELPAAAQRHRHLVRYRISAVDGGGRSVSVPYSDDPQPNFAYFVYDGTPPWYGAIEPGAPNERGQVVAHDFNAMRPLPVYHFLAQRSDVEDAQFIPNSHYVEGYMGDDYLWQGTLVYQGRVYDHIGFRARGGAHRYAVGKNMWKFNFHKGHRFQAYDNYGQPYPVLWDKLNFSAVIQNATRGHRGEQGLFESINFRLFNLAGVPASNTHFLHFRVVDGPAEQGGDQYGGDFWGLYLAIQEVDGHFLAEHNLPDGNLYKMEEGTGELNNQGLYAPLDKSDLNAFLHAYEAGQSDAAWWRQNVDLATYFSYRAIIETIHHYDVDQGKNYLYFHNPETHRWSVFPWDLDLTWSLRMTGSGNEPFRDRVLPLPAFQVEYQNRLRELRDLLFNSDQMFPLIDEYAALVNTPADGLAMVDADRAKWDYNPILANRRYTVPERAAQGRFYVAHPWRSFAGMVHLMKDWVVTRSEWIDGTLLTDPFVPQTPAVSYVGPPERPADGLQFQSTPFVDPHAAFAAMEWRVAEVMRPGLPGYAPNTPNRYEIEATWQSGELSDFVPTMTLPPGVCAPDRVCRVRVRMKNTLGRWSHWSPPVEFYAGPPAQPPITTLKITELMYHPLQQGYLPETEFEFVELQNVGNKPLDLTNLSFTAGISFTFPVGAALQPGETAVLAGNAVWFETLYGFAPQGEYRKKLNNSGDRITLTDTFGRTILDLTYSDQPPWPVTADGLGHSLVLNSPEHNLDPNLATNWRASYFAGGSPGVADPLPLVINEVLAHPAPDQSQFVELHNPAAYEISLAGWSLRDGDGVLRPLPAERLAAGSYRLYTVEELSQSTGAFVLGPKAWRLELVAPTVGKVRRYQHRFPYGVASPGVSSGRYINAAGEEKFPLQQALTPGAANAGPLMGPVVLNKIQYNGSAGLEFIELTNLSNESIPLFDPERPANTWRLSGSLFQFATGVTIPAGGKIVITSNEPAAVCTGYAVAEEVRVLGPLPLALDDQGQRLALERPLPPDGEGLLPYAVVDELSYTNLTPWPRADEPGVSLERLRLDAYGDDPLNWRRGLPENNVIQPAGGGPVIDLCSFEAYINDEEGLTVHWVTRSEQNVTGFLLYRSADGRREHAEQVTDSAVPVVGSMSTGGDYRWLDPAAAPTGKALPPYTYWLVATGAAGESADLAFTSVRARLQQSYLPFVYRN